MSSLFVICCWIVIKHSSFVIIRDLLLDCHKTFIFYHQLWFVVGWVRKHSICPDNIVHDVVERKLHYFWGPDCRQRPIFELQKIQMSIVCNRQRCHSIILDIYGWYIGWMFKVRRGALSSLHRPHTYLPFFLHTDFLCTDCSPRRFGIKTA